VSILTVNLAEKSYDILTGKGLLSSLGQCCTSVGLSSQAAVVTNPTVRALYGEAAERALTAAGFAVTVIEIPDGEEYKNADTLSSVYDSLIEAGLDRQSFIVALGGGVVGDLAGYAAATYLRGIPFVQVPTTLLAQVDSSVGGKTAIDHPRGKNLIGAFYQPRLVLIDVDTLSTLPDREYRAGLAEVVKYGVVLDLSFFEYLEQHAEKILFKEAACLEFMTRRCCEIKARVVEHDEKESGLRAVLNYGHTLGHAFETLAGYRELVHGEAVALGMVLATRISAALGHCSRVDAERVSALISRFGLQTLPPHVERRRLLEALAADKKNRQGAISFICNHGIGDYAVEPLLPEKLLTLSGLEVLVKKKDASFWSEIKSLDGRLAKDPDSFCFARLSQVYLKVGLVSDALHTARHGVARHPGYLAGQRALAMACNASGLNDESRGILETVTAAMPDDVDAQKLLATLYIEVGDTAAAVRVYHTVLDFRPDDAQSRAQLDSLQQAGSREPLYEETPAESAVSAETTEEEEILDLDESDIVSDEEEPAEEEVSAELSIPSAPPEEAAHHDPLSTQTLAELYEQQGFTAKALDIYRAVLADDPSNSRIQAKIQQLELKDAAAESLTEPAEKAYEPEASLPSSFMEEMPAQPEARDLSPFIQNQADNVVGTLDSWLENIRRIKACR
jgi:3-dehydroquinate synthase